MNIQHIIDSIRLLTVSCLISLVTITYLTSSVKGSNVKADGWSNAYNQHLYSDLTGTIRELRSADNVDDTDTRFQPPLDTNNKIIQPVAEGYSLVNTEIISPALSVSNKKDSSHERHKRDVLSTNSSTPTVTLQSSISINTEPMSPILSNNVSDDDSIISEADANSWAQSLSLISSFDGSGDETTTETSVTETAQTEESSTSIGPTSFTLVSSASTTITSLESTQTEEVTITGTETSITTSSTSQSLTETETASVSETEASTTSSISQTATASSSQITIPVSIETTTITSSIETGTVTETEISVTSSIPTITENVLSTVATETSAAVTVSESNISSLESTLSSESSTQTSTASQSSSSFASTSNETPTMTEIETSSTTQSTITTSFIQTTVFYLYFTQSNGTSRRRRQLSLSTSPPSSSLENQVEDVLSQINVICSGSCIQISPTNIATPPNVEYSVTLYTLLDIPSRILLVNTLLNSTVTLNQTYFLNSVLISMNVSNDNAVLVFNETIPLCKECEYDGRGNCSNNNTECTCYPSYEGYFCRDLVPSTTFYYPTSSMSTSTITLSTTTISSIQTSESITGTAVTLTESATIASESSTATITIVSETTESSTLGTAYSTTSTATSTLLSATITETTGITSLPTIITETISSTLITTSSISEGTITSGTSTLQVTIESTSSTITVTAGTSEATETAAVTSATLSSTPTLTSSITEVTVTGEATSSTVTTNTGSVNSITTSTLTAQTISFVTTTEITEETITGEASSSTATIGTGTFSSTQTSTVAASLISSTGISSVTEATVTGETSSSTVATGTSSSSTTQTSAVTTSTISSTGISSVTQETITGESSSSTAITGTGSSSTTQTSAVTTSTISSTGTSSVTEATITGETSSSTVIIGTGSSSTTQTSAATTSTISSTGTSSVTQETITGATSSSTVITGTGSSSTTQTSAVTTSTISSTGTSSLTEATITGETSSSTVITGTGSSSTTQTSAVTTSTISSTGTSSVTQETITGQTSSSTAITGTGSSSTTQTSAVTTSTISSTGTSSVAQETVTGQTSSSTAITGTGSSSTTQTSAVTTSTISSTGTSSVTQETITGQTSSSTVITGTGSSSTTQTSASTASSTETSSVTQETITGQTSSSTAITGTGSSTTQTSPVTTSTISSTGTSSVTQETITGQTSSSTAITGTGSSTTQTSAVTTSTISSTGTSSVTQETITGQTSSSTAITGTGSSSTTQTSTSTVSSTGTSSVTQETITGQTSSSTAIIGTGSSTTQTSAVTTSTISSTGTSSVTQETITGQTSSSTAITGTGSTTTQTSAVTTSTISSTGTSSATQETITGQTFSSTITTGTGSSSTTQTSASTVSSTGTSSVTQETITGQTSSSTAITGTGSSSTTQTSTSTVSSTGTSSVTQETITGQTSSSTAITGTGSSTTQTSAVTTSTISSTGTSSATQETITGQTFSSTITTGTGSSSTTQTSASTVSSTGTSSVTQETITGQTSSSTAITGTGSSSTTQTSASTVSSTGTSSVTQETITGQTSTLTTITATTSVSGTGTSTVATETISYTTVTGSTGGTVTSQTSSASITTGTSSSSNTTISTVVSETSSSATTTVSSTNQQTVTSETAATTTFIGTISSTISNTAGTTAGSITTESTTLTASTSITSSLTTPSVTTAATMTTTTTLVVPTTQSPTTIATTTITPITRNCSWTNWIAVGNCTPSCGTASQQVIRSCYDPTTGLSCDSVNCGGGYATQNQSCAGSPPCETITVTPVPTIRDPRILLTYYLLPDTMYFVDDTYRRIWITNKGYIAFDTPYYGQTMTSSIFGLLYNQAIAAPFWTALSYDSSSSITINWLSSLSSSQSDINSYSTIIQRTVMDACPVNTCSLNFTAVRVLRINWQNLYYQTPSMSQATMVSFTAYLINTYETASGSNSYPVLRSYLSFDYSNLTKNLGYLKPFVGYRGRYSTPQIRNDPSYYQNAAFLQQSSYQSFFTGAQFLTQCQISFLQETNTNNANPAGNLNDVINNPTNPCPCSLGQAKIDRRFGRLSSETYYESLQGLICYGPLATSRIGSGSNSKLLASQTCCYNMYYGSLITYGALAGSVLSNPSILFQSNPSQRRITFHDACCSPSYPSGQPNWNTCRLYYQLHPVSTCTGYQPPVVVSGVGDPHISTIDNGRYTCHIQGLYIFSRTSNAAYLRAQSNTLSGNIPDSSTLYPDDLYYIYVRSVSIPPALPYVERMQGDASIFNSYTIGAVNYTFVIINNNGKFGFTATNQTFTVSLTNSLANNLNYDYINTMDPNQRYIYRVQQTNQPLGNTTVPQLVFTLWSGLSIQCQINSENLECILLLPKKYYSFVEGLAGNFNGNYTDDLLNFQTNTIIPISSGDSTTYTANDAAVLSACLSWKVPNDTTTNMANPIMPVGLVNWYYNSASTILSSLNSLLNQTLVNQTCSSNFDCIHDYIIRINPVSSSATAQSTNLLQQSRSVLVQTLPTINITLPVQITVAYGNPNRSYSIPILITGANNITVIINQNGTNHNNNFNGASIIIPAIPNDNTSYVEVSLNLTYGINYATTIFLNIIACLCTDSSYCNYNELTTLSNYYQLASCDCAPQYDGTFCQSSYNACNSVGACQNPWSANTTCIAFNSTEQVIQGKSYVCNGTCLVGYNSTNGYTCDDIDECTNSTICGNGNCTNTIGSYTCQCPIGYTFGGNGTCVDIDECTQRYVNGIYTDTCSVGKYCVNTIGSFNCICEPIFNTTGTCIFNASLCTNDTCTVNGSITCIHGTNNINNACIPWCQSTCSSFCQLVDTFYQCNCSKWSGFQPSNYGTNCAQCDLLNYGYGCNQSCQCNFGTCNANATNVADSCNCPGYLTPACTRHIDICSTNNPCDPNTQDCQMDLNSGAAMCTCKNGYGRNSTNYPCTDIDECALQEDQCNLDASTCNNTIGSYNCICLPGYQSSSNNTCTDINECNNATACSSYNNTYCTNIPGSYECRCNANYSLGGDYTQIYGNARNSNLTCLITDLSPFCQNQCLPPASCSSLTGQCQCPSNDYTLVTYALNNIQETCQCPGYPYTYFNGSSCINATGQTWFLLNYVLTSSVRLLPLNPSNTTNLQNDITDILCGMNITCDNSSVTLYDTQDVTPPNNLQIMATITNNLSPLNLLILSNNMFNQSITYNDSYNLISFQTIINNKRMNNNNPVTWYGIEPKCLICSLTTVGSCNPANTSCNCFTNYTGDYCQDTVTTNNLGQSPIQAANWTIIVAVVSAIAGLLLIISIVMCIFYFCTKHRQSTEQMKTQMTRQQFTIPRAHLPTMGTVSRGLTSWDGFSLDNTYDEQFVDASDSFPSSSNTSYNTTYRTNGQRPEADFGIFDELENRIPMSRGHIPRPQMVDMLGTLNSFPTQDQFDDPSGGTSIFSESRDLDEIELVTDMLDDMTKDDDMDDEFVEALNPNLAIPRLALQPEMKSSGWFSFFRNS